MRLRDTEDYDLSRHDTHDILQIRTVPLFVREVFYAWLQEAFLFNTFVCLNPSTFEETKFRHTECYLCV
jgi:hypothetical protein